MAIRGTGRPSSVATAATAAPERRATLISSAVRIDMTRRPPAPIQTDWQEDAWRHFDLCGELAYAAGWMGNSLSRATIYVADVVDGAPAGPTKDARAKAAADGVLGGPAQAAQILASLGLHLTVPGDVYVLGETPEKGGPDQWTTASTTELTHSRATGWQLDQGEGKRKLDLDRTVLIRVWQSHPRKRWEAYSPTRSVLPVLAELEQLSQNVAANLDSRLAGAGILAVAKGATLPIPEAIAVKYPGLSPLAAMLTEAMVTAVADRSDASALVPIILEIPTEGGASVRDQLQWINFFTELRSEVQEGREKAIRRIALGMDMEPEALLGLGGINHWGAWQIDQAGVKLHVEPKLLTVVAALNDGFYRPNLEADGLDPSKYCLWFDTSDLVTRPDQSANAQKAYDAGELSGDALLRYLGLDSNDRPKAEERTARLLTAAAKDPATLAQVLPALLNLWDGRPIGPITLAPAAEERRELTTGEDTETTEDDAEGPPAGGEPPTKASAAIDAPTVTAHLAVRRALELAGKRMLRTGEDHAALGKVPARERYQQRPSLPEHLERQLAGAWDSLDEEAPLVGLDVVALRRELTTYTTGLLLSGKAHDVAALGPVVARSRAAA